MTYSYQLYAITNERANHDLTLVEEALKGGVTILQYRDKVNANIETANKLKQLCKKYDVPLIINDDLSILLEVNADGIHVGQDDLNAAEVKQKIEKDQLLGVSCHNLSEALKAEADGADYIGVGALFDTQTKTDTLHTSVNELVKICQNVSIPVVGIGGINHDNITELMGSGIDGVCISSGIFNHNNPKEASELFKHDSSQILGGL